MNCPLCGNGLSTYGCYKRGGAWNCKVPTVLEKIVELKQNSPREDVTLSKDADGIATGVNFGDDCSISFANILHGCGEQTKEAFHMWVQARIPAMKVHHIPPNSTDISLSWRNALMRIGESMGILVGDSLSKDVPLAVERLIEQRNQLKTIAPGAGVTLAQVGNAIKWAMGVDVELSLEGGQLTIRMNDSAVCGIVTDLMLLEAQHKVRGEREAEYGNKLKNFTDIAGIQSLVSGQERTAEMVALDMVCVKLARLLKSPDHYDTLVDMVGYVMCYRDIRKERNPVDYDAEEARFRHTLKKW